VALLRKSVLSVLAIARAGLAFLHFGYIDWIALQAVPWTSTGEYLAAWGSLRNVFRKDAVAAVLTVGFTGEPGTPISSGISVLRADSAAYTVASSETIGEDGTAIVSVQAQVAGTTGNCEIGTELTLGTTIEGVQSTGSVTGTTTTGVDTEEEEDFRARVISAFQETPQGGDADDYVLWALAVPGVTRAWCSPNGFGAGTVVLRFMMDNAQAAHGGFPQGTNGVSQFDQGPNGQPRDISAVGDQLVVADAIVSQQPVTALVYACAPLNNVLNFQISGLSGTSQATRDSISAAIADVLFRNGDPRGGTINRNDIDAAINSIPGTGGWLMQEVTGTVDGVTTTYPGNITSGMGALPTLGGIDYV
jgi:uncharacterized phage protein gp47/JayE